MSETSMILNRALFIARNFSVSIETEQLSNIIVGIGNFSGKSSTKNVSVEMVDYFYIRSLFNNINILFNLIPSFCEVDLVDELQIKLERIRETPFSTKRITNLPVDIDVLYIWAASIRLAYHRFYDGSQKEVIRSISLKIAIDYLNKADQYQLSLKGNTFQEPNETWFYQSMLKLYSQFIKLAHNELGEKDIIIKRITFWQNDIDWCHRQLNWIKLRSFGESLLTGFNSSSYDKISSED